MSYSPPTGAASSASWWGASAYSAPVIALAGAWSNSAYLSPAGVSAQAIPQPVAIRQQFAAPNGIAPPVVSAILYAADTEAYIPSQYSRPASWSGEEAYSPSTASVSGSWSPVAQLFAQGIPPGDVDSPTLFQQRLVSPSGLDALGAGNPFSLHPWQYAPAEGSLIASWVGRDAYSAGGLTQDGLWTLPSEVKYIPLTGLDELVVPTGASIKRMLEYLSPSGIGVQTFGSPSLKLLATAPTPAGFDALSLGSASLSSMRAYVDPAGIYPGYCGEANAWNWRRFIDSSGQKKISFDAQAFGEAMVAGRVRTVAPSGYHGEAGSPTIINTRATRTTTPAGIDAPALPSPAVSPRFLFTSGVHFPGFGAAFVQRNPSPWGFDAARLGEPWTSLGKRSIGPGWLIATGFGFPTVRDLAQRVLVPSLDATTIFGDIALECLDRFARAAGFDSATFSDWALFVLRDRALLPTGIDPATAPRGDYTPPCLDQLLVLDDHPIHPFDVVLPRLAKRGAGTGYHSVENAARAVLEGGVESLAFGEVGIGEPNRSVFVVGIPAQSAGAPSILITPSLSPAGFSGVVGAPTVWPRVREVQALGDDRRLMGSHSIWFAFRSIDLSGFESMSFGSPAISDRTRRLLAKGRTGDVIGAATVALKTRTIAPDSIFDEFATRVSVGFRRWIYPDGFDPALFGARIIPGSQSIYPQGFRERFGQSTAFNLTQHINGQGFLTGGAQPADRWGKALVWPWRQIIEQVFDPNCGLSEPAWSPWTLIENRNRPMRATGFDGECFGAASIENAARPLLAQGIAPDPFEPLLVAMRVRPVRPEAIEAPYMSGWGGVYNDAFVIAPRGSDAASIGRGVAENTRRYFQWIGAFDAQAFGDALVAYRIRSIDIESRYGIAPPDVPLPEVKQHTHYINPVGSDMSGVGLANLEIHWTIITPRWTQREKLGEAARVWNLTPELAAHGADSQGFGEAAIRTKWRRIEALGDCAELFGRASIADADRTVFVAGLQALAVSDRLRIKRLGLPPYATQTIYLDATTDDEGNRQAGHGIGTPEDEKNRSQLGLPSLNQQEVHVGGFNYFSAFGKPDMRAMASRPEGIFLLGVGEPWVSLSARTLSAPSIKVTEAHGKPRMSPFTIWAMTEAPEQAKENHPQPNLKIHPVDGLDREPGAEFGSVCVAHKDRSIVAYDYIDNGVFLNCASRYGEPSLALRRKVIEPKGFLSFKGGIHLVPNTQTVEEFEAQDALAFGEATAIEHGPWEQWTVFAGDIEFTEVGDARLELKDRQVFPSGALTERMGAGVSDDTPYQWQRLRVGAHVPSCIGGLDSSCFGEAWISLYVREAPIDGFDAFVSECDLERLDARMRVTRTGGAPKPTTPGSIDMEATPLGLDALSVGVSNVRLNAHFIRPDGFAEQFHKGAPSV